MWIPVFLRVCTEMSQGIELLSRNAFRNPKSTVRPYVVYCGRFSEIPCCFQITFWLQFVVLYVRLIFLYTLVMILLCSFVLLRRRIRWASSLSSHGSIPIGSLINWCTHRIKKSRTNFKCVTKANKRWIHISNDTFQSLTEDWLVDCNISDPVRTKTK